MSAVRRSGLALLGFAAGVVAGAFVWSRVRYSYRRQLFSARPLARFVALTYLSARPSLETARVLGEYLRWEQLPSLRRQAMRLLHRVERRLEATA